MKEVLTSGVEDYSILAQAAANTFCFDELVEIILVTPPAAKNVHVQLRAKKAMGRSELRLFPGAG